MNKYNCWCFICWQWFFVCVRFSATKSCSGYIWDVYHFILKMFSSSSNRSMTDASHVGSSLYCGSCYSVHICLCSFVRVYINDEIVAEKLPGHDIDWTRGLWLSRSTTMTAHTQHMIDREPSVLNANNCER